MDKIFFCFLFAHQTPWIFEGCIVRRHENKTIDKEFSFLSIIKIGFWTDNCAYVVYAYTVAYDENYGHDRERPFWSLSVEFFYFFFFKVGFYFPFDSNVLWHLAFFFVQFYSFCRFWTLALCCRLRCVKRKSTFHRKPSFLWSGLNKMCGTFSKITILKSYSRSSSFGLLRGLIFFFFSKFPFFIFISGALVRTTVHFGYCFSK